MTIPRAMTPGQYSEAMERAEAEAARSGAPARLRIGLSAGIILGLSALLWRLIYLAFAALTG